VPQHPETYPSAPALRIPIQPQRIRRGHLSAAKASSILLGSVIVLILAAVIGMALGAWRFRVIDTGSMRPTLNPGDIAILTPEPIGDLKAGQIVAFHPPGEEKLTVTHRVFTLHRTREGVVMQTKGDANNAVDPWRARIIGSTAWHEVLKMPKLGYLVVWSQQHIVHLILLLMILVLAVGIGLGWIWRVERG
jgi:signal peptidase I